MTRFLTLLAATLATASAQMGMGGGNMGGGYGGGGNNNMGGGMSNGMGGGMGGGMGMGANYGAQKIDDKGGSAWMGLQQAQMSGATVIIIAVNNGGSSKWQQYSSKNDMYGMNSSPQTHQVTVGAPGLAYTPNSIQAKPGDYVQFNFMSENHTATQSNFNKPCVKMMGGVDSGFMPNKANGTNPAPAMKVQVMNSQPMWFYCKQKQPKGHCGAGMTFSVNPTAQKTQAMFTQMAMQQNGTGSMMSSGGGSSMMNNSPPPSSVVQGNGQQQNGACQCQCLCGTNQYAAGMGIGMMGGLGGMMPMSPAS